MHQKRRPGSNNNGNGASNNNHRNHRNNNGRNKYRSGSSGGGGYDSQNVARVKKHAQTQKEKYQNMARDAQVNGERVDAEYYFQHVEHYTRVLAEIEANEPKQERREERHDERSAGQTEPATGTEESESQAMQEHHDNNDGDEEAPSYNAEASQPQRPRRRNTPRSNASPKQAHGEEIPLPASVIPPVIAVDGVVG